MQHWRTGKSKVIYKLLRGFYNCYLVVANGSALLFDSGRTRDRKKLFDDLESLRREFSAIDFIVLSHTHYDHSGNVQAVARSQRSRVVVSENEIEFLLQGYSPLPRGTNIACDILTSLGNRYAGKYFSFEKLDKEYLHSPRSFSISRDIVLIPTPGHSPGSQSLMVDGQICLVGDVVIGTSFGTIFPPFGDDIEEMLCSWQLLLETPCHTFLPGHGKPIQRGLLEKEYQRLRKKYRCAALAQAL